MGQELLTPPLVKIDASTEPPQDWIIFPPNDWEKRHKFVPCSYCNDIYVVANDSQRKLFGQKLLTPLYVDASTESPSARPDHFSSEMTNGNNEDSFVLQRY